MNNKPKILCFIDWFLPGFNAGGQIQSLKNAVNALHDEFDFFIVCRNTDLDNSQPYTVLVEQWVQNYNAQIYYVEGKINYKKTKAIIQNVAPNFIYFSSFFSVQYTVLPLIYLKKIDHSAQIVVGPRGMLGTGALALKPAKKKLFIFVAKLFGLYRSVIWHASTELEKEDIVAVFGSNAKIRIACDIPQHIPIKQYVKPPKSRTDTRFCFLSRISTKKNLVYFLLQLKNVTHSVQCIIVGPIEEPHYWEECQSIIAILPANIKVSYLGSMPAQEIVSYLSENIHFFVLPTLHENFGHVIIEALSAACPVLISDQTPWRNLESQQVGWDIPLAQSEDWARAIKDCCEMNNEEYLETAKKAQQFAAKFCNNPEIIEANKKLFEC